MRRTRTERLAFPTFVILPPPLDEDDRDKDDPDEDFHDNDKIGYEGQDVDYDQGHYDDSPGDAYDDGHDGHYCDYDYFAGDDFASHDCA